MTDKRIVATVVAGIIAVAILGLAGCIWLISIGAASEDVTPVVALTGPAIGAVATLLVSTSTHKEG